MNEYIFINTYMQVNFYMVTFTEQCINEKRNVLHVKKNVSQNETLIIKSSSEYHS